MWPRISFHWHSELSTIRWSSCLLGRCFLWDYRMNIFQRLITVSHLIICCCNHQVCSFDSNFQYKFLTVFSFKKTKQPTKKPCPQKTKTKPKQTNKKPPMNVHWNKSTKVAQQKMKRKGTTESLSLCWKSARISGVQSICFKGLSKKEALTR